MNLNKELLDTISKEVDICTKCPLYKTATHGVAGYGNPNAEIIFIGEAPGANEDKEGRPFVGQSGNLLDKNFNVIKLERKNVWIGNIIKHRPPNNRDPLQKEVKACKPYIDRQVAIIKPKLVVTLGRYALTYFIPNASITTTHGRLLSSNDLNIYPLYHPAAALRNGKFMKTFVQDFIKIPSILEQVKVNSIIKTEKRTIESSFT